MSRIDFDDLMSNIVNVTISKVASICDELRSSSNMSCGEPTYDLLQTNTCYIYTIDTPYGVTRSTVNVGINESSVSVTYNRTLTCDAEAKYIQKGRVRQFKTVILLPADAIPSSLCAQLENCCLTLTVRRSLSNECGFTSIPVA